MCMNVKDVKPSQELHSHGALATVFPDLNNCAATMHFARQTTIFTLTSRGTGETYRMPHHLTVEGGKRQLMIAALRYYDTVLEVNDVWFFAERLLCLDWIEGRPLS